MALKALVTIDDATVAVNQIVFQSNPDGTITATFYGTVNRADGTKLELQPASRVLTSGERTTIINFATSVGVPSLKTTNGI